MQHIRITVTVIVAILQGYMCLKALAVDSSGDASLPVASSARTTRQQIGLTNPSVEIGLELSVDGRKLTVSPGTCWVNDNKVEISSPGTLDVLPAERQVVVDEAVASVSDKLNGQFSTTVLTQCRARSSHAIPLEGLLVSGSLRLKSAPGEKGKTYKTAVDFLLDGRWGALSRLSGSSITSQQTVYADYQVWMRRLDTLVVDEQGRLQVLKGLNAKSAPEAPFVSNIYLPLANIYVAPGNGPVLLSDLSPIYSKQAPRCSLELKEHNRACLTKTLAKLQSGQPVTVVFWGDSVTGGADASSPNSWFANLFIAGLKKNFPSAAITTVNLGLGGTNTKGRTTSFKADVLEKKPDLIVVEFVNDLLLPAGVLGQNYSAFIALAQGAGAEVILCTPHFPEPKLVGVGSWQVVSEMPYIKMLRRLSQKLQVALADVALRWERLSQEGLQPKLLLVDEVIHPNDTGHAIYAQELLECFN